MPTSLLPVEFDPSTKEMASREELTITVGRRDLRTHAIVARLVQIRNELLRRRGGGDRDYRLSGVTSAPEMALDESATGVAGAEADLTVLCKGGAAM